jgi:hypothetical protein
LQPVDTGDSAAAYTAFMPVPFYMLGAQGYHILQELYVYRREGKMLLRIFFNKFKQYNCAACADLCYNKTVQYTYIVVRFRRRKECSER